MLKLFTDLSLLQYGSAVTMLIPFVGIPDHDKNNIEVGRFDVFFEIGKSYIHLTDDIENSDIAILPIYWPSHTDTTVFSHQIEQFVKKTQQYHKKIFVFAGHSDISVSCDISNAIIFTSEICQSTRPLNYHTPPHFFEDYINKYYNSKIPLRKKEEVPVIGFCGYAPPIGLGIGKEKLIATAKLLANYAGIIRRIPSKSSHSYRARAILALQRSNKVITNFRIKSNFAFGPGGLNTGDTNESNEDFRLNFVKNIVESDYTLCVRGIGNNSIRFYETLCCGRIPLFINTDSVLPFDHLIDWKKYAVWVEEKDIDRVGDIVADFHRNITPEHFKEMQLAAREVWKEYLSPLGFYKNLKTYLPHS